MYMSGPMPGTGFTATSKMNVFPTPQELATWLQAVTVTQTYIFNFKIERSVAMLPNSAIVMRVTGKSPLRGVVRRSHPTETGRLERSRHGGSHR